MNLKDAKKYQDNNPHMIPTGTIIACPEPLEINQVLHLNNFWYKITKELTKEEFDRRHIENLKNKTHVIGEADLEGYKTIPLDTRYKFVGPDYKFFYEMQVLER